MRDGIRGDEGWDKGAREMGKEGMGEGGGVGCGDPNKKSQCVRARRVETPPRLTTRASQYSRYRPGFFFFASPSSTLRYPEDLGVFPTPNITLFICFCGICHARVSQRPSPFMGGFFFCFYLITFMRQRMQSYVVVVCWSASRVSLFPEKACKRIDGARSASRHLEIYFGF